MNSYEVCFSYERDLISGRGGKSGAGREAGHAAKVGLQLRPLRRPPRRKGLRRRRGRDRRSQGRLDVERRRAEVEEELRPLQGGRRGR